MIVTDLLVMLTVMANSAYDTTMGFLGQRDCLSAGQGANGTNTWSENIIESFVFCKTVIHDFPPDKYLLFVSRPLSDIFLKCYNLSSLESF